MTRDLRLLRPPISTLFPYTTLFRSGRPGAHFRAAGNDPRQGNGTGAVAGAKDPGSPRGGDPGSFAPATAPDRKSTRLNSSHSQISYAVFCLKKKKDRMKIIALIGCS